MNWNKNTIVIYHCDKYNYSNNGDVGWGEGEELRVGERRRSFTVQYCKYIHVDKIFTYICNVKHNTKFICIFK